MFGTWVNLLDTGARGNYEADLWRPAISGSFQADQPTAPHPRAQVHALVKRMNWARNRVNHCEPVIFGFPRKGQITAQGVRLRTTPHQLLADARNSEVNGKVPRHLAHISVPEPLDLAQGDPVAVASALG